MAVAQFSQGKTTGEAVGGRCIKLVVYWQARFHNNNHGDDIVKSIILLLCCSSSVASHYKGDATCSGSAVLTMTKADGILLVYAHLVTGTRGVSTELETELS